MPLTRRVVITITSRKSGTRAGQTFIQAYRSPYRTTAISSSATGMMTITSMRKVDDTHSRAFAQSPQARWAANLLRRPFPKPMSNDSTQTRKLAMVIQMPFLYSPKHRRVAGTSKSCTSPAHPFTRNEAKMFFRRSVVRLSLLSSIPIYI